MDLDQLRVRYPFEANDTLAISLGITTNALKIRAHRMGIHKDPAYVRKIQRVRMLGRHHSERTRSKIAASARGRRPTPESKRKALETKLRNGTILRGEAHPNWKGGRPWLRFRDPRYIRWRTAVLTRDCFVCQDCGRRCARRERGLAAHHLQAFASHPELRYEVHNGITLCRECHMRRHGKTLPQLQVASCACGCGTLIPIIDRYGRERRFVNHHAARGRPKSAATKKALSLARRGKRVSAEHRAKIAAGLRAARSRRRKETSDAA